MIEWKPIDVSPELMEKDIELFGMVPDSLIELYSNREADPKACEDACDAFLREHPENGAANMYKASIEEERGDWESALTRLVFITERTPRMYVAWERRGLAELALKRPTEARLSFMHYLRFRPDSAQAYVLLAFTYYMNDDTGSAYFVLDDTYETNECVSQEDKAILLWARAFLEKREGDFDAAFMHLVAGQMTGSDELKRVIASEMHKLLFLRADAQGIDEDHPDGEA